MNHMYMHTYIRTHGHVQSMRISQEILSHFILQKSFRCDGLLNKKEMTQVKMW